MPRGIGRAGERRDITRQEPGRPSGVRAAAAAAVRATPPAYWYARRPQRGVRAPDSRRGVTEGSDYAEKRRILYTHARAHTHPILQYTERGLAEGPAGRRVGAGAGAVRAGF